MDYMSLDENEKTGGVKKIFVFLMSLTMMWDVFDTLWIYQCKKQTVTNFLKYNGCKFLSFL